MVCRDLKMIKVPGLDLDYFLCEKLNDLVRAKNKKPRKH